MSDFSLTMFLNLKPTDLEVFIVYRIVLYFF